MNSQEIEYFIVYSTGQDYSYIYDEDIFEVFRSIEQASAYLDCMEFKQASAYLDCMDCMEFKQASAYLDCMEFKQAYRIISFKSNLENISYGGPFFKSGDRAITKKEFDEGRNKSPFVGEIVKSIYIDNILIGYLMFSRGYAPYNLVPMYRNRTYLPSKKPYDTKVEPIFIQEEIKDGDILCEHKRPKESFCIDCALLLNDESFLSLYKGE